jgi:hypothetical protein
MAAMPSGIDHVVIAVADPDAAAAELSEAVGVAFTAGGRHEGLGTFNRIAFLGDAYLELIGVADAAEAQGWAIGRASVKALERGGGFATWALLDDAIQMTVPRLQAGGSSIGPVLRGSRLRSDREVVEWWTASPEPLGPELPPLLIKHLVAGAEWGADALAARRAFVHPIGFPLRLDGIDLAVDDPFGLAAACAMEVGLEFRWDGVVAVATAGRHTIRLTHLTGGGPDPTIRLATMIDAPRRARLLGANFVLRPGGGG